MNRLALVICCCLAQVLPSYGQQTAAEALIEAQAICSDYLGIPETRVAQYNVSVYPPDRDTMCMIRCAGIILGFWDDGKGLLLDGARQFFPATVDPTLYSQKVLQCIERKLATCNPADACAKAYFSFRCVLRRAEPTTPPPPTPPPAIESDKLTPEKYLKAQATCAKILRIPPNHLQLYKQGIFPDDAETRCLFRCLGIRTNLYSDTEGPDLERLHAQFAEDQPLEEFKAKAQLCMEANRPLVKDNCTAAYRNLYLCFKEHFNAFSLKHRQTLLNTTSKGAENQADLLLYSDDI
uniref:General odorant-binding protein 45 n=1 Tax=Culex pipiens TaxID=7175 RepID=A0A8D8IQA7_CULPI